MNDVTFEYMKPSHSTPTPVAGLRPCHQYHNPTTDAPGQTPTSSGRAHPTPSPAFQAADCHADLAGIGDEFGGPDKERRAPRPHLDRLTPGRSPPTSTS
jgi:hypothetical protein